MLKRMINRERIRGQKAFTLIELLVVIAIIALLLAILMPGLQKAKKAAMTVVCAAHQKQVLLGLLNYAQDNEDRTPIFTNPIYVASTGWQLRRDTSAGNVYGWPAAVMTYIGGVEERTIAGEKMYVQKDFAEVGNCPMVKKEDDGTKPWCFGVNYPVLVTYPPSVYDPGVWMGGLIRLSSFPGSTLIFMDASPWRWWIYNIGMFPLDNTPDEDGVNQYSSILQAALGTVPYNYALFQHNKGANVATIDGSVIRMDKKVIVENVGNFWQGKEN